MLKVITLLSTLLLAAQASATPYMTMTEQQIALDKAYCSVVSENYARGILQDKDMKVHEVRAEVSQFSNDIYTVVVETQIHVDIGLLGKGPQIGFSCVRCPGKGNNMPNLELIVTQDTIKEACAKQK